MIPCKKDSCLKLAICKWKKTIFCTPLYRYHSIDTQEDIIKTLHEVVDIYRETTVDTPIQFRGPIIIAERLQGWVAEKMS